MTLHKELNFANKNELESGFSIAPLDKNSAWPTP